MSGVIVVLHSNDDVSLFVPLVNIPVSLDNLLQGIASINDRFDLARFNEFFQGDEILRRWGCCPSYEGLTACHPCPEHAQTQCRRSERLPVNKDCPFVLEFR